MTEQEWLTCTDPQRMLSVVAGTGGVRQVEGRDVPRLRRSDRKLRLFACACCRQALEWSQNRNGDSLKLCDLSDEFADGKIAYPTLGHFEPSHPDCSWPLRYERNVHDTILSTINARPFLQPQAALLRDIFGNPFRPVSYWTLSSGGAVLTAVSIAQAIYDERAFDRMPILADALEESGCANEEILNHCRGMERFTGHLAGIRTISTPIIPETKWIETQSPHVRGCWVIDLLLGKE